MDLGALPIPGRGTYAYDTTLDLGPNGTFSGDRTLSYYSATVRDGAARALVRQTTRAGTSEEQKEWWFRFSWTPSGFFRDADYNPSFGPCHFDRPLLEVPLPLAVGRAWRSASSCEEGDMDWRLDARATKRDTVTIGGRAIDVVVIERELVRGAPGAKPDPLRETWWWSPKSGLIVKMRTRGAAGTPLDVRDTMRSADASVLPKGAKPPQGF